jgi:D-alanine-D-alanine ligase-like ATP-grasp enzyme
MRRSEEVPTRRYVLTSDGRCPNFHVRAVNARAALRLLSVKTNVLSSCERVEVEATGEVVWAKGEFVWRGVDE